MSKFKHDDRIVRKSDKATATVTGMNPTDKTYSLKLSGKKVVIPMEEVEKEFDADPSTPATPAAPTGGTGGAARL